jgi:integrase
MRQELEQYLATVSHACPYLLQKDAKPVLSFYKAWKAACRKAKVPTALFHDLRRTAVTNMIDAGLSEVEAMSISGHKTHMVFERYNIKSAERTQKLGERLAKHKKGTES